MAKFLDNQIIITDEAGVEHNFIIIFTYENEEREKKYVFFSENENSEDVMAMIYDDDGNLFEIEDDEEYSEVEEVFGAYNEDPKIQEIK